LKEYLVDGRWSAPGGVSLLVIYACEEDQGWHSTPIMWRANATWRLHRFKGASTLVGGARHHELAWRYRAVWGVLGCWFGARWGRLLVCLVTFLRGKKGWTSTPMMGKANECDMKIAPFFKWEYFGWWSEAPACMNEERAV
jgi:hypothetical protein